MIRGKGEGETEGEGWRGGETPSPTREGTPASWLARAGRSSELPDLALESKFRFVDKLEGVQRRATKTIRGMQLNWSSLAKNCQAGSISQSVARGDSVNSSQGEDC